LFNKNAISKISSCLAGLAPLSRICPAQRGLVRDILEADLKLCF